MLLAMGAIGRGSNVERYADANVTKIAWGTIPGFDAFARRRPSEPTLAPGAVLFCSGLAVLAIGLAL
jgi:hypothetical protein